MKFALLSIAIAVLFTVPASAGTSKKSKVTTCSSYTNINGTTKTTCWRR